MLPIKTISDSDLIVCSSFGKPMSTSNIHPLYLPPVVCWLNAAYRDTQRVKAALSTVLKVISGCLLMFITTLHVRLLMRPRSLGLAGTMWCSGVVFGLVCGVVGAVLSSKKRDERADVDLLAQPAMRVNPRVRSCVLAYTVTVFILTFIYEDLCASSHRHSYVCGDRPFPRETVWWTIIAGIWITVLGMTQLCCA